MSVLRFVHTDHLRLGSPLTGLADCPDWLRRIASAAVRKSVANVIEAAIASRSHFLLISGRIVETPQDHDVAVAWLAEQTSQLEHLGIRVVITAYENPEHAALRRLNAILCSPDQQLMVSLDFNNRAHFRVSRPSDSHRPTIGGSQSSPSLVIQRAEHQPVGLNRHEAVYRTVTSQVPEQQPSHIPTRKQFDEDDVIISRRSHFPEDHAAGAENWIEVSEAGILSVAARSSQSLGPSECGPHGCRIVEVNLQQSQINARFCATDVVRFAREELQCYPEMTASDLVSAVTARSRQMHTVGGRISIVDWDITGSLYADSQRSGALDERSLLSALRNELDAGHSGVWPRRIYCDAACSYRPLFAMNALAAG